MRNKLAIYMFFFTATLLSFAVMSGAGAILAYNESPIVSLDTVRYVQYGSAGLFAISLLFINYINWRDL